MKPTGARSSSVSRLSAPSRARAAARARTAHIKRRPRATHNGTDLLGRPRAAGRPELSTRARRRVRVRAPALAGGRALKRTTRHLAARACCSNSDACDKLRARHKQSTRTEPNRFGPEIELVGSVCAISLSGHFMCGTEKDPKECCAESSCAVPKTPSAQHCTCARDSGASKQRQQPNHS